MGKLTHTPKARKKSEGFSLMEVFIAILILSIGLIAAGSTLVASFRSREYSRDLTAVTNLAQKTMEEIKTKGYAEVVSKTDSYYQIPGYENCKRVITVTPNADDTLKQVDVEVTSIKGRSVKLVTLVSKR